MLRLKTSVPHFSLLAAVLAIQKILSVLVHLQLRDHHLGRVDADWDCLAVGLISCHALN